MTESQDKKFSLFILNYFSIRSWTLKTLIEIHLSTHKSTSNHSLRNKYRSAIYYIDDHQQEKSKEIIEELQLNFEAKIITQILEFKDFKPSTEEFQNYYQQNPQKPFCEKYINPKLTFLVEKFANQVDKSKISHLNSTI